MKCYIVMMPNAPDLSIYAPSFTLNTWSVGMFLFEMLQSFFFLNFLMNIYYYF